MYAAKTPPHIFTLILLTGVSPMSLNMFLPSLAHIAADLDTDYSTVSWAVSGYLAVTAVIQLIIGPLADQIGRRPVLLVAIFVFTAASVGCALAQSIGVFLFFRILQSSIISGYALSLAIVRDTRSERQAVSLIGYIGMSMAIAPMLGPMIGGALDVYFGWRAIFAFYVIAGFCLFILCWCDLGETLPDKTSDRAAPWAGTMTLIREARFWAYALCGMFSVGAFYIFLTGAPLVATSTFHVSTAALGVYIGTITVGFMFGSFVADRIGSVFTPATVMIAGRVIASTALLLGLALIGLGATSRYVFFGATIFVGFGNGITVPGSNAGAMSVRPDLAGSAAGLSGALVVAGGAVLTALTGRAISEISGPAPLLLLMLVASGLGLLCAIWAKWLGGSES